MRSVGGGPRWIRALWPLVRADLRQRYGGSALAALWALVLPLIEVAAYVLLFGLLLRPRSPQEGLSFALYLACGILPWAALREALEGSAAVLGENRWIRRSTVPLELLVARRVASALPRALTGLLVALVGAWASGARPGPAWLLPLVALYLQAASAYALGLILAPLAVLYTDLRPVLTSALTVLTFASPILYPEWLLSEGARRVLEWNPYTSLLRLYRLPLGAPGSAITSADVLVALATPAACLGAAALLRDRLWWPARDRL